jgi:trehalose/maltose hydrolase-like predicted phosphorylase
VPADTGHGSHPATVPDETFEALIFDWDGTAVPDRRADAGAVRQRIEALSLVGIHVFILTGTHSGNVDDQLGARPTGRGRLFLCCNRGSEVFEVSVGGLNLVLRRTATAQEDAALSGAAKLTVERLGAMGLEAKVVSERLNRRKIDLIPDPAWSDPKKADIALLLEAVNARLASAGLTSLAEVVDLATDAARASGLPDPRITSDVKHVEIGLTDKSDSARFVAGWLADRGITGGLVLIGGDEFGPIGGVSGSDSLMVVESLERAPVVSVGVEPGGVPPGVAHLGGGPGRWLRLLDAQLARRAGHRVPRIDHDPAWVVPLPSAPQEERVAESLGALGNGWVGTRGSREEPGEGASPLFLVNGIYSGDNAHLLSGPTWTDVDSFRPFRRNTAQRLLDLRTGVLMRPGNDDDALRSLRFVSAASPHAMAFRAEAPATELEVAEPLRPPLSGDDVERENRGEVHLARSGSIESGIAVAAQDAVWTDHDRRTVERLAGWVAALPGPASFDEASDRLAEMRAVGFDGLLADHREAWARRWADAEVVIEGDPGSELSARLAVFHLLSAAPDSGEAAVGPRGLTGDAYGGHVFWDADVFVLPALSSIRPGAARAMLEYRVRRLRAARAAALEAGMRGARFPWESAADGSDVTPRAVRGPDGRLIPIATGAHEQHIVSDVAWAAAHYTAWTGDAAFLSGVGRDLVIDTARYWASRIRVDEHGKGHLYGVEGPDEYHGVVDDNAYTNVMARWNLRRGAELLERSRGGAVEAGSWRVLAGQLVDGWSPERGLYEQFAGYFDLEPLLMSEVAPPPVAVDMVLGAERVAGSQLIKQVDVLMLHHLVPEEVVPGSLGPCLAFYEPRTAHGSSLSPGISALLHARAGQPERALELFRLAARLDLDDLTRTTAGGVHLATMGGVWQSLAFGFVGLRAERDGLAVSPCLPEAWRAVGLRLRFRGQPLGVRAEHDRVTIACDLPIRVRVGDRTELCRPPRTTLPLEPSATEANRR